MSIYGYEIKTSRDFFGKLLDEREDFLLNPTSSRHAINCALTGWHLHEWIYQEYKSSPILGHFTNIDDYRKSLYTKCHSLSSFRDLADGSKHFSLGRPTNSILNTEVKPAGSDWGFTKKLESPTLVVRHKMGGVNFQITFDDLLYDVTFFWYSYFNNVLKVEVNSFFEHHSLL
jgi:hypothetical protein